MTARIAIVLGLVACANRLPSKHVPVSVPAVEPAACSGTATRTYDAMYAVQFELANRGGVAISMTSYAPLLFGLAVSAGGKPVTMMQSAFDGPMQIVTLTVPAHGSLVVNTPVRLRLAPGGVISDSAFVWTIDHSVDGLTAIATLQLPEPFDAPCPIVFAHSP